MLDLVEHDLDVGGGASDDASAEEPFGVGGRGDERRHPHRRQRLREAGDRVDECGPLDPFRFDAVGGVVEGLTEGVERAANSLSRRVRSVRSALTASTSATCVRRLRSSSSCSRISTAAANSAKAACTSAWTCARRRPPRAMPSRSRNLWNTTESAPFPRILGGNTLIATVGCRGFVENRPAPWSVRPRRRGPGGGAGSRARCGGRSTRPTGRRARGSCRRRCGPSPPGRARPASPRAPRRRPPSSVGDDRGILLVVPTVDDPLVPPHRNEHRVVLGLHQEDPLPLHLEHVADVARVLQRGPDLGRGSRPHPILGKALERAPQRRGVRPERRSDLGPGQLVVVVAALVAVHGSNVTAADGPAVVRQIRAGFASCPEQVPRCRPTEGDPWN